MTKEQYAAMLAEINETNKNGGDISACIAKYREKFLVSEAMNMGDRNYEMYVEKKNARAEGREEGIDILESLGVSQELIAKARKIAAQSSK